MKANTKVSWIVQSTGVHGNGVTIADEDGTGHILVAVHSDGEVHHVIYCTVTWLTVEA